MKKILILILLLPIFVRAIGFNGAINSSSNPGNSTSGSTDCTSGIQWVHSAKEPAQNGIRVTFYTNEGVQLGYSVDVWAKKLVNQNVSSCSNVEGTNFKLCGYSTNFVNGAPSRIDYMFDPQNGLNGISGTIAKVTHGQYKYYVDNRYDNTKTNPFWFNNKDSKKQTEVFKNYFTNPDNIQKLMKIAEVEGIDASTSKEYLVILEPMAMAEACKTATKGLIGVYTASDFTHFIYDRKQSGAGGADRNSGGLNRNLPRALVLAEDATFGNITISAPTQAMLTQSGIFTIAERTTQKLGLGMSLVYGEDICKENCEEKISYY